MRESKIIEKDLLLYMSSFRGNIVNRSNPGVSVVRIV